MKKNKKKPVLVFLVGPTASGKSEIAVKLAKLISAEIISADSMQVYKQLNVISAKPSKSIRKAIAHHLVDFLDVEKEYSASFFREQALGLIDDLKKRKRIPLFVGGTGLYIKALLHGLFSDKGKNEDLRKDLEDQANKEGNEYIYNKLKHVDPKSASLIHPNDIRRVIRALEVFYLNKVPMSTMKKKTKGLDKIYNIKKFALDWPRKQLYARIESRVDKMVERGLLKEVKKLSFKKLSNTASKALGIRQIQLFLNGEISQNEAIDMLKRDTRRYSKRQLTWFRQDKSINWIKIDKSSNLDNVAKTIYSQLLPYI